MSKFLMRCLKSLISNRNFDKTDFQNLENIASFFKQEQAQMIHCKKNRSFYLYQTDVFLIDKVSNSDKMQIKVD